LLQRITAVYDKWPLTLITNGTLMVIRRFYETALHDIPSHANALTAFAYRMLNKEDFSIAKYSAKHFTDFVRGMHIIASLLQNEHNPPKLKIILEKISDLLTAPLLQKCFAEEIEFSLPETLSLAHFMRRSFKQETFELMDLFSRLDAYASMAIAGVEYGFTFSITERF